MSKETYPKCQKRPSLHTHTGGMRKCQTRPRNGHTKEQKKTTTRPLLDIGIPGHIGQPAGATPTSPNLMIVGGGGTGLGRVFTFFFFAGMRECDRGAGERDRERERERERRRGLTLFAALRPAATHLRGTQRVAVQRKYPPTQIHTRLSLSHTQTLPTPIACAPAGGGAGDCISLTYVNSA